MKFGLILMFFLDLSINIGMELHQDLDLTSENGNLTYCTTIVILIDGWDINRQ